MLQMMRISSVNAWLEDITAKPENRARGPAAAGKGQGRLSLRSLIDGSGRRVFPVMMHAALSHGLLVENAVADFHYLIEKRQRFGSFEGHARAYLHAVALIAIGSKHFSRILTQKQLARKIRARQRGKKRVQ
jgi:hypothetical protein